MGQDLSTCCDPFIQLKTKTRKHTMPIIMFFNHLFIKPGGLFIYVFMPYKSRLFPLFLNLFMRIKQHVLFLPFLFVSLEIFILLQLSFQLQKNQTPSIIVSISVQYCAWKRKLLYKADEFAH